MTDLVVTCPKTFWREWIAEGDAVGDPPTGTEWGWYMTGHRPPVEPGDRLYVVAWNMLRGYAPVVALKGLSFDPHHGATSLQGVYVPATEAPKETRDWCICRRGGAVAVTIPEPIKGFQGWRRVNWSRETEVPFPDWQTKGVGA